MAKKENIWNADNTDVWAYPEGDEEKVSAQDGTIIREYHVDNSDRIQFNNIMFCCCHDMSVKEEKERDSDESGCDYEKEEDS